MGKLIDMTGWVMKEHGYPDNKWTVIKRVENDEFGKSQWLCQCECGTKRIITGTYLRSKFAKDCGCSKSLKGQRFEKLIVLEKTKMSDKKNGIIWKCQCDCGNICYIPTVRLKNGTTKSCGCLNYIDLTNQKFGKLTAIEPTDKRYIGHVVWRCKCDCGNECFVDALSLTGDNTKSCGCLGASYGEYLINQLLEKNNIPFETEKTFDTCIFKNTNRSARFDFYINNQYIIEFDGIQHFKASGYGWDTEEHLSFTQEHDKIKTQWCKENNIPLIRIPYTHLNSLCLEDLLLDTSKFVI